MKLIDACGKSGPTCIRNRAIISTLWRTGLRISEALDLQIKDVNFTDKEIRVLRGKNDKSRCVGIDAGALSFLNEWITAREFIPKLKRSSPLFCTLEGSCVSSDYIRQMLPRLGRRAGIAKRVHAHGLRHTYAVELYQENIPQAQIQALLGHSNLSVTSVYLRGLNPKDAIESIHKRPKWR